jgi:putative modified peptide
MNVSTAAVLAVSREAAETATLLHRLVFDDAFRARLQTTPREALAEVGLDIDDVPAALELPTRDQARAVLVEAIDCGDLEDPEDGCVFAWFV